VILKPMENVRKILLFSSFLSLVHSCHLFSQPLADKEGKPINITVTIHLFSSILIEDDKLWSAVWDAMPTLCV